MSDNLKILRKLTKDLTDLVSEKQGRYVEYNCSVGVCIGEGLYKQNNIAVQKAFLSKGTIFDRHDHGEKEFLICYEGIIEFTNKEKRKVGVGEIIIFDKNHAHSCEALEDSQLIAVTIPASKGYPEHGKRME